MAVAASAGGRAARATWLLVARGAGTTARSVGRARDIEPGHRRDGIALGLLALAVVVASASWFDAARPVGPLLVTAAPDQAQAMSESGEDVIDGLPMPDAPARPPIRPS